MVKWCLDYLEVENWHDWISHNWRKYEGVERNRVHVKSWKTNCWLIPGPRSSIGLALRCKSFWRNAYWSWCTLQLWRLECDCGGWSRKSQLFQHSRSVVKIWPRRRIHQTLGPRVERCASQFHSRSLEHAQRPLKDVKIDNWGIGKRKVWHTLSKPNSCSQVYECLSSKKK